MKSRTNDEREGVKKIGKVIDISHDAKKELKSVDFTMSEATGNILKNLKSQGFELTIELGSFVTNDEKGQKSLGNIPTLSVINKKEREERLKDPKYSLDEVNEQK